MTRLATTTAETAARYQAAKHRGRHKPVAKPVRVSDRIEIKSRKQKLQLATILENKMPDDFRIQVQVAMMVGELEAVDFVSYCAGMPMFTVTVRPDEAVQALIKEAMTAFHEKLSETIAKYEAMLRAGDFRLIPTERRSEEIV